MVGPGPDSRRRARSCQPELAGMEQERPGTGLAGMGPTGICRNMQTNAQMRKYIYGVIIIKIGM